MGRLAKNGVVSFELLVAAKLGRVVNKFCIMS